LTFPRILAVTTGLLALAAALAPQAWAPVPPRDCGMVEANGQRFNVKADQIRCRKARRYTRRYLVSDRKPRGYSCQDFKPSETHVRFRCTKGVRVLFAIRR
jgi:hypothetical protein